MFELEPQTQEEFEAGLLGWARAQLDCYSEDDTSPQECLKEAAAVAIVDIAISLRVLALRKVPGA